MFRQLFGSRHANLAVTDALYEQIVAGARQPHFYSAWGVPDTPLGRFEMLSLHMFLFLHRLRGEEAAKDVAQDITDEFFRDVDHSLRELGISDMGVPKRIKKLAKMFYGRAASYGEALDKGDANALVAALARNVMPETSGWQGAVPLAGYGFQARQALAGQKTSAFMSGALAFPAPEAAELEAQP
jgi:cytochrome b pre-mRNA-processing protein 3